MRQSSTLHVTISRQHAIILMLLSASKCVSVEQCYWCLHGAVLVICLLNMVEFLFSLSFVNIRIFLLFSLENSENLIVKYA